jgi:xanthine dehydrogenase accessory factor
LASESILAPLLPLFARERAAGRAVALGILVHTSGSTYRRPGALLLIAGNGEYSGLLSGGCLEGDLVERARAVIQTGQASLVTYDLRNPDDLIWGLGIGCEGAMSILLLRVGPPELWQPLEHLGAALLAHSPAAIGVVTESSDPAICRGALVLNEDTGVRALPDLPKQSAENALLAPDVLNALFAARWAPKVDWIEGERGSWKMFLLSLSLPPKLLLLGAGPDVLPVVEFAAQLHWRVSVIDHRPAYANPAHFPAAERVLQVRPRELADSLNLGQFSAAVIMSHHFQTDLEYLRVLSDCPIQYIGLLGPHARREKLLAGLGPLAGLLSVRLRAPVGLDLGGRTPEAVALAIVAEIQAFLQGMPRGVSSRGGRAQAHVSA